MFTFDSWLWNGAAGGLVFFGLRHFSCLCGLAYEDYVCFSMRKHFAGTAVPNEIDRSNA